jgi:hypothetical protein
MFSPSQRIARVALAAAVSSFAVACGPSSPASPKASQPAVAAPRTGYTAGPVAGGGTIRGKVTLAGDPPALPPARCSRDQDVCGKPRPNQALLVGEGGGLANVIVSLTDIHAGKAPVKPQAKLDIKQCAYSPRVQVVPVGTSLLVTNADPIPHDLGGSRGDRVLFSRTILRNQERIELSSPGMLTVGCDMHEGSGTTGSCETGVIGVMPNPYFALTARDGSFTLADVPPGTYTLQAWHETLGDQSQQVTVAPSGGPTADFHFTAKAK